MSCHVTEGGIISIWRAVNPVFQKKVDYLGGDKAKEKQELAKRVKAQAGLMIIRELEILKVETT